MSDHNTESFYNTIAKKYDWFFSSWEGVSERQMAELVPLLRKHSVKTVLDCSCGTGLQSIGLAKNGFHVIGSDISKGMLVQAAINSKNAEVNIDFIESDFRFLGQKIEKSFDAVICMGNSLPHLLNIEDVEKALSSMYEKLNESGLIVIEMRDYDYLLSARPRFWPMRVNTKHEKELVTIIYALDYLESVIKFNVIYIIQDVETGKSNMEVESLDYNPIRRDELINSLKKIGFREVNSQVHQGNVQYTGVK